MNKKFKFTFIIITVASVLFGCTQKSKETLSKNITLNPIGKTSVTFSAENFPVTVPDIEKSNTEKNDYDIKIINNIPDCTINEIYLTHYGEKKWSNNLLATKVLAADMKLSGLKVLASPENLIWDIKAKATINGKEKTLMFYEIDLTEFETPEVNLTLIYDDAGNPAAYVY